MATYLRLPNYSVVALKPEQTRFVSELREALAQGVLVSADEKRDDFYDVELAGGCFYIHVYSAKRIVYLVARFMSDQQEGPRTARLTGFGGIGNSCRVSDTGRIRIDASSYCTRGAVQ
jgi:hypothetical protein